MFQVNDYIIYGGNGVCKVIDIGIPAINMADKQRQYYKLQPIYENGSTVYVPVDNDKVVMRKIISKEEAMELINDFLSIDILGFEDDKMREEKYKELMHKYDCRELIKIIKTSYQRKEERLAEGKKNTATDDKYLKMAEDFLYGELAISLSIPKEQVLSFILNKIKKLNDFKEEKLKDAN